MRPELKLGVLTCTAVMVSLFHGLTEEAEIASPGAFIGVPTNPEADDFAALREASPFVRILNPAEIYTLKGVATLDDQPLATLYNRETKKSLLVSPDKASDEGIKLVEVAGGEGLEGVTATVSFAGEEVELKYQLQGLYPHTRGSGGPPQRGGGSDDGERRGPSQQDIERYKQLSDENRNQLRQYIGHIMKTYPNMSREERGNMIRGAMTRLSDGRGLDIPQVTQGGDQQIQGEQRR